MSDVLPLQGDEVKTVDLSEPEQTIAEKVKLNPQKETRGRLKF